MSRSFTFKLFLSLWVVYLFHFNAPNTAGPDRYFYLTAAIVERHTVNLDPYPVTDCVHVGGHKYSNTNPGMALAAVPFWAVFYAGYRYVPASSFLHSEVMHIFLLHLIGFAFTSAIAGALTGVILAKFIYHRTGSKRRAVFTALLYNFGSIAFFFSTRMSQNSVVGSLMLALFVLAFSPDVLGIRHQTLRFSLLGFLAGLAILIDLPSVPIVCVLAIPVLWSATSAKSLPTLIVSFLVPVFCLILYLNVAFHDPFRPPQSHMDSALGKQFHGHGLFGIDKPDLHYALAMLVSLRVGLFVYMPYLLLAVWLLFKEHSGKLLTKLEYRFILAACFALFVFISGFSGLQDTFGPRFLLPILPYLFLVFGLYMRREGARGYTTLFWTLIALGFLVNIAGAEIGIDTSNVAFVVAIWLMRGPWLPILNWLQANLSQMAGFHPSVISSYGLLIVMVTCLVLIWQPKRLLEAKTVHLPYTDDLFERPVSIVTVHDRD